MTRFARLALAPLALLCAAAALAQSTAPLVQVEDAWARASVAGQKASGAFMRLTAREPLSLVGGSSPVAGAVEVHEMKLDGDVMRMRALPSLDLPAGKAVEFKPGGYHLMLQDLKAPLQRDTQVPVTLLLREAQGAERKLELQLPVRAAAPSAGSATKMDHSHHHKH